MKPFAILTGCTLVLVACNAPVPTTFDSRDHIQQPSLDTHGPIVNYVSVGGSGFCHHLENPTWCQANISLVAFKYQDGSVSGQWQVTQFEDKAPSADPGGFHPIIKCLDVLGNRAWITATLRTNADWDASFSVVDNGASVNDPPDEMSALLGEDQCGSTVFNRTDPMPNGQVVVR